MAGSGESGTGVNATTAETDIRYDVTWSGDDDAWVATCTQWPSLSWLADTPESAIAGLRNIVRNVVQEKRSADGVPLTTHFGV